MGEGAPRVAAVTGASSGIGAATAAALAAAGFHVFAGARRVDRAEEVLRDAGPVVCELDVRTASSVDSFVARIKSEAGRLDAVVTNAGVAYGRDPVAESSDEDWDQMWQTNVMGMLRMTRACLPLLRESQGQIVNVGSVTSFEVYPGGAGYAASKWAVRALTRTLRLELNGQPIRVTEVDPGLTETEFSLVRFRGDAQRSEKVYAGSGALQPADVADCVVFAVTRPRQVNIDELVVRSVTEASSYLLNGRPRW